MWSFVGGQFIPSVMISVRVEWLSSGSTNGLGCRSSAIKLNNDARFLTVDTPSKPAVVVDSCL